MRNLRHVMTDLETMGTVPGCAGLSIGAVVFCPHDGVLQEEFYSVISLTDSLENFLTEDEDTKDWWRGQSEAAKQVLRDANDPAAPALSEVLERFNSWALGVVGGKRSNLRLYGNGADFDNPILQVMYAAAKVPFLGDDKKGFYGGRCYRTLKSLDELFGPAMAAPKLARTGTHHNALDDAKSQARHLIETIRIIKRGTITPDDGK